jgi:hypothetical protein
MPTIGTNMQDKKALSDALKQEIDAYISARSTRSIASLARKCGLGYSTIRRLAQGEATPELSTVVTVIGAIKSKDDFLMFLKEHFPKEGSVFEQHFVTTSQFSDESLDYFLRDEISSYIIHLTATHSGSTVENISRILGERGLAKLDDLVDAGFIERNKEGKLHFYKESFAITNFETFLKNIQLHVGYFNLKNLGSDAALLAHQTQSVDAEGLRLLKEAGIQYCAKIAEIKRKRPGDIPFYISLMQNVYDNKNLED